MAIFTVLSPSEQVAGYLFDELMRGRWREEMPGAPMLAGELGIDSKTAEGALRLLEGRGLLVSQGPGRRRRIELPEGLSGNAARPMRISIFLFDSAARQVGYLGETQHALVEAGHSTHFVEEAMVELGMEIPKIRRVVKREAADAWVVVGGARGVLEWFGGQGMPTFALFGRHGGLPIAATRPEKIPAYAAAVDKMVELGHRRISLLARKVRRLPSPGRTERAFLERLEAHGIQTGSFNLPDWDDSIEGFQDLLEGLFRITPPTALIIQEAFLFVATYHFLARRGLRVPEDVSLVCSDGDSSFDWCVPPLSHIRWDSRPMVRRIVSWAGRVSHGRQDIRQTLTKAEFVEGGTIGPAPESLRAGVTRPAGGR